MGAARGQRHAANTLSNVYTDGTTPLWGYTKVHIEVNICQFINLTSNKSEKKNHMETKYQKLKSINVE